ncbi:hypothetical protein [Bosea sp. (in: a-proteobacteria)]|uniref:hypothetical protein n=1 Tax=Bosea sp. (in: a-proteobacteria) TaxID=1871050 RepID=UPI002733FD42|nr:hypothetical protein [Bosea sp. (in: a-proteobacteria)]MDP3406851.1 hypothetical protein [Bosea sp. (in: a-proteobacteria)]
MAAIIASTLSICWFLALALYIAGATTGWTAIDRILQLEPNNFGDFLSGAFAPVAFAWLAYSVVMQSSELALQREEIKETREVLKAQEQAQRESAKRTSELSDLSKKQLDLNITINSEKLIDNSVKSIVSITYAFNEMYIRTVKNGSKTIWNISRETFTQDDAIVIELLRQGIDDFIESVNREKFEFWVDSENKNNKNLNNILVYKQILDLCDHIIILFTGNKSGIKSGNRLFENISTIQKQLRNIMEMKVEIL